MRLNLMTVEVNFAEMTAHAVQGTGIAVEPALLKN